MAFKTEQVDVLGVLFSARPSPPTHTSWLHMSARKLEHLLLNVRGSLSRALPGRPASTRCFHVLLLLTRDPSYSNLTVLVSFTPCSCGHPSFSFHQFHITAVHPSLFLHPHVVKDELMGRISSSCVATFSPPVFFQFPSASTHCLIALFSLVLPKPGLDRFVLIISCLFILPKACILTSS